MKKKLPLLFLVLSLVVGCDRLGLSTSSSSKSSAPESATTSVLSSISEDVAESSEKEPPFSEEESSTPTTESDSVGEEPTTSVPEPDTSVDEPSTSVPEPDTSVEEPSTSVEEPDTSVEEPDTSVEEPDTSVEEPSSSVDEPSSEEPLTYYTVTFYKKVNVVHAELLVAEGELITVPLDPVIAGDEFIGWYFDLDFELPFDPAHVVTRDLSLYAKWASDEVVIPEYTPLHFIGETENLNLSYISWGIDAADERSYFTYDSVTETYTYEIELGYGATFKIKEPFKEWNTEETGYDNIELTYFDLNAESDLEFLTQTANYDIEILNAGVYLLTIDLNANEALTVTYINEPISEGVTLNPPLEYTVTFYLDLTTYYAEVTVTPGETLVLPLDPILADKEFVGWYLDLNFTNEFTGDEIITSSFNVYAKFIDDEGEVIEPDVPEYNFHAIGNFMNGDENVWDFDAANSYYHFGYNNDTKLYRLKISIGHNAEFKVKEIGLPWDTGTNDDYGLEYSFNELDSNFNYSYLERAENNNIRVTLAGEYELLVDLATHQLKVTWLKHATDQGLAETIYSSSWGIVGTHNDWGNDGLDTVMKTDLASGVVFRRAMKFNEGDEWKIRVSNEWVNDPSVNHGAHSANILPEGMHNKESGDDNIVVTKSGYYTVVYDGVKLIVDEVKFALRGNALATGWQEDSAPLELVNKYFEQYEPRREIYEYSSVFTFTPGEYRFKLASLGPYLGLDYSPRPGSDLTNYKVTEETTLRVTLKIIFDDANDTFLHTYSITAA
ncbi:MAG TPA: InlB B-repeat-containing protein [Bacilli bacterium]|nr:InlB B-repeat-containing protein [Bacilli bacterium]